MNIVSLSRLIADHRTWNSALGCVLVFFFFAQAASGEDPGLLAWWKMDAIENGKVADASGNGRDLTVGSGVSVTNGAIDNGLWYDGTVNAYSSFACPALTSRTVCVSFYAPSGERPWVTGQTALPYLLDGISSFNALYVTNSPTWTDYIGNGIGRRLISFPNAKFSWNQWNHMAWTINMTPTDNENVYSCSNSYYLNGVLQGTSSSVFVTNPAVASTAYLGNGSSKMRAVFGTLDEVRIYDRALSDAEIQDKCFSLNGWDKPRLIGNWTKEAITETNGVRILEDQSGNGNSLTLGDDVSLTNGVDGNALSFAGTANSYASLTNLPSFSSWSVAGWVRQSSLSSSPSISGNLYPRILEASSFRIQLGYTPTDLAATYQNYSDSAAQSFWPFLIAKDTWSHFAVVTKLEYSSASNAILSTATYYVNGKKAGTGKSFAAIKTYMSAGNTLYFGNNSAKTRPLLGELDDLAFFSGALSDTEVASIYRGLPVFDAGSNFTCAVETTALQGTIEAGNTNSMREGYSGGAVWSLVSSPAGGSEASILSPEDPQTPVVLPALGTYVFRLTMTNLIAKASRDVSVTRVASVSGNEAPAVTLSQTTALCTNPAALALSATVQDPDNGPGTLRVTWSKLSGTGGVYFASAFAPATAASFTAPGSYVLQCKADDGQDSSAASVAVTVEANADSLTDGLVHHWPMNGMFPLKDTVGSTPLSLANGAAYVDGVSGYGMEMRDVKSYINSTATLSSSDFITISMWLYENPANTNLTTHTRVIGHNYLQLQYENLSDGTFLIRQFDSNGENFIWRFAPPSASLKGRWCHITACFDRRASDNPRTLQQKVYVDGIPLPFSALVTNEAFTISATGVQPYFAGGKFDSTSKYIFGGTGSTVSVPYPSRLFPGTLDDIRIYDRQLTDAEIAALARTSSVKEENRAPLPENFPSLVKSTVKKQFALNGRVYDDGLPGGNTMACQWKLLSGNTNGLSFLSADSAQGSVLPLKIGTYLLQLQADDGERKGFSAPVEVKISNSGTVIRLL